MENPAVIDMMMHDPETDAVKLVMVEPRPWDGSEKQLYQLQEKFNAYMSFALDGEMAEAYPALADKPLVVELECATAPDETVLHFLGMVRDQVAFQGISVQVKVMNGSCGEGCGCHGS